MRLCKKSLASENLFWLVKSNLSLAEKLVSSSEKTTEGRAYTNKIEKIRLLLELTSLEICAQNQRNSVSGDVKCKKFPGGGGGGARPQTP